MNIFDTPLTLNEMELILEDNIRNHANNLRIIGDLDLSKDDYKYLRLKLKGIIHHEINLNLIEKYKLCILAGQVFAFLYETDEKAHFDVFDEFINKLYQYQIRGFVTILSEAFCENGIETFGVGGDSLTELYELIGMHVGLIEKYYVDFFGMLNESLDYYDVNNYEERISEFFYADRKRFYKYLNNEYLQRMFVEARELFIDCKVNNLTKKELYQRYPLASSKIIENCIQWCKVYNNEIGAINRKALLK